MVFPEPAIETRDDQESSHGKDQEYRTFSVYPQEGARRFPLIEYASLEKPLSCAVVMGFARNVMICGWIWRRKPS